MDYEPWKLPSLEAHMARVCTEKDFLDRFRQNDLIWRIVFENGNPHAVEGPLTIVEILFTGNSPTIYLRDNAGNAQEISIEEVIAGRCAVFEYGTEAHEEFEKLRRA